MLLGYGGRSMLIETVLNADIQENGRVAMIRGDEERLRKMI